MEAVIATHNKNKVTEMEGILREIFGVSHLYTPGELGINEEPEENGKTFEENALLKARFVWKPGRLTIADDSGLCVNALGGAPGVFSARYAGDHASDAERIRKLLDEMKGKTNRRARFVCVIALAYRGTSVKTFRGEVNGTIIDEPRGAHGFGYDPVFVPDGYDKTFGELGPEVKDKISHRAKALEKIVAFIQEELDSMDDFEFE